MPIRSRVLFIYLGNIVVIERETGYLYPASILTFLPDKTLSQTFRDRYL